MVAGKRIQCAICKKKCSGNVLRFQDQYYHKQCFHLEAEGGPTTTTSSPVSGRNSQAMQEEQRSLADQQTLATSQLQHSNVELSSSRQTLTSSSTSRQYFASSDPNGATSGSGISSRNQRGATMDTRRPPSASSTKQKSSTLPPLSSNQQTNGLSQGTICARCEQVINDGQALIALDKHWHVNCFKCAHCKAPLHGEYVAKDGSAYCERDYQALYGVSCVYCKRYITGKVLQAGDAHLFHPSCARCSKCGDPFVAGEEMYLQGEVTWHPRCGPGPEQASLLDEQSQLDPSTRSQLRSASLSSRSRSRSASPFSYMSRQGGRSSPGYADSETIGDLSRVYTISYLNADPTQGYLRRPIEPRAPKSPQFSRPTSVTRSRSSSRSHHRDRSIPRGMYSVLSSMQSGSSSRARSPSMMNEEAIQLAQFPSGQRPSPDTVPKIERDDFPAPPFPYVRNSDRRTHQQVAPARGGKPVRSTDDHDHHHHQQVSQNESEDSDEFRQRRQHNQHQHHQQRNSRPRSREIVIDDEDSSTDADPQLRKEEQELSKIANGIGKIFLQTLKEREKLRAWKKANLDPRNASRTPSATRELPSRLRYNNPLNASPSRDLDRARPWEEDELTSDHSPTRTKSSLGKPAQSQMSSSTYGYKVVQSNRSTPKPGYGLSNGLYAGGSTLTPQISNTSHNNLDIPFNEQRRFTQNRSTDLLNRATLQSDIGKTQHGNTPMGMSRSHTSSSFGAAHLRRSMPNVNLHHLHQEGPPKLYPYHILATSNYRLPPDVDRCHLERHLSNEEFQYIFHCDRLYFYRLPEWKRNELKRRAKLF